MYYAARNSKKQIALSIMMAVIPVLFMIFCKAGSMAVYAAPDQTIAAQGTCGDSLNYVVTGTDQDGYVLTITGSGSMATTWSAGKDVPWFSYNKKINEVNLPSGLTYIGKFAFFGMSGLTQITIPEGVNSIGANAFLGCDNIAKVINNSGMEITLPTPVTGSHWIKDGSTDRNRITKVPAKTTAVIVSGEYGIEFYAEKGVEGTMPNQYYRIGNTYPAPECTLVKNGFVFTAWNTKYDGTGQSYDINSKIKDLAEDGVVVRFYPQFKAATGKVSFDPNGGSRIDSTIMVTFGEKYGILPQPVLKGYKFEGWYTAITGGERIWGDTEYSSTVTITGDHTLYARWSAKRPWVAFDCNGGSGVSESIYVTYGKPYGESGALPVPVRKDHSFDGWYTSPDGGEKITDSTICMTEDNHKLYAHWSISGTTVTGIRLDRESCQVSPGDTFVLTATVEPSSAENKKVLWSSSGPDIVSVDNNGKVTAKSLGWAYIIAKTEEGEKSAWCKVTVETSVIPDLDCKWSSSNGTLYWYEKGIRQGTFTDTQGIMGDGSNRGREIYDAASDAWYWLDSVYSGAKAVNKEVWIPYVYQDELKNCDNGYGREACGISDEALIEQLSKASNNGKAEMADQVKNAIRNRTGKWVRYNSEGHMIKGWYKVQGADEAIYPSQVGNIYYYDQQTGLMAKGRTKIGGKWYTFDEKTGVLQD